MKIFFDTEFLDHGTHVELLALGAVREDGETFYAENGDCDLTKANDWVQANVIPHLTGPIHPLDRIARDFRQFCGGNPQLWAYFGTYDHMLVLNMYGGWMGTPEPMRVCHDVETLLVLCNQTAEQMPKTIGHAHNALNDAWWVRNAVFEMM